MEGRKEGRNEERKEGRKEKKKEGKRVCMHAVACVTVKRRTRLMAYLGLFRNPPPEQMSELKEGGEAN